MHHPVSAVVGLCAALAASLGYGLASVLQAVGARRAPAWPTALGLARQPAYLVGVGLDGVAWVVSLVALRTLPLFAVQALLAGSLAVTAVAGVRVLRLRLGRAESVAVVAAVVGSALVAAGADPGRPRPAPPGTAGGALVVAALLAVLVAVPDRWLWPWLAGRARAVVTASAAGVAYSAAALCARLVEPATWLALLAEPAAWAVVVSGAAGTLLYARSLSADAVVVATATLWVVEVVVGGAAGLLLLGDGVRPGWTAAVVVGVALALAACVQLARPSVAASWEG